MSSTTKKLGLSYYAAWLGSLFMVATNQAPHTLKPAPPSSPSVTHFEFYTLVMNMQHTLIPYHRHTDGIAQDGLCLHVLF